MIEKNVAIANTLTRARDIIASPEKWTQGKSARNERGNAVNSRDPKAICWCMLGALGRATSVPEEYDAAEYAMRRTVLATLAWWNDQPGRTHADVIAAFDRAIASLEAA